MTPLDRSWLTLTFGDRYQITSDISRWGVIGTDAPGDLILSAFSTMSGLIDMDKIAFTLFTGDIVSHDNDVSVSEEYVMFEEQNVFDTFKAEMKNTKGDIVSLPVLFLFF